MSAGAAAPPHHPRPLPGAPGGAAAARRAARVARARAAPARAPRRAGALCRQGAGGGRAAGPAAVRTLTLPFMLHDSFIGFSAKVQAARARRALLRCRPQPSSQQWLVNASQADTGLRIMHCWRSAGQQGAPEHETLHELSRLSCRSCLLNAADILQTHHITGPAGWAARRTTPCSKRPAFLTRMILRADRNLDIVTGFHRWRGAWLEHRAAVARVAGCVTRQRISFRFFKQWYWGMFDEEIQARARVLSESPWLACTCKAPQLRRCAWHGEWMQLQTASDCREDTALHLI